MRVAVVGAGLAGLACATDLGANVCFAACTPPAAPAVTLTPGDGQVQRGGGQVGPALVVVGVQARQLVPADDGVDLDHPRNDAAERLAGPADQPHALVDLRV